jgi:hypothetical protein
MMPTALSPGTTRSTFAKHLKIAVTGACALACACSIALWIRSYWRFDTLTCDLYTIDSASGQIRFDRNNGFKRSADFNCMKIGANQSIGLTYLPPNMSRTYMTNWLIVAWSPARITIWTPQWIPTYILGAAAVLTWIRRPYRFSMRGLLLGTAAVAALFAIAVNSV